MINNNVYRLYVLSQCSEETQTRINQILELLRDIESEVPVGEGMYQKKVTRARIRYEGCRGFSADGFFHLNRGLMTAIVGALATYLIVLLQFKQADLVDTSEK